MAEDYKILSTQSMWKADWSKPDKCGSIRIYEYDIPLPPMPAKKSIEGYHLVKDSQKFKREEIPQDIHRWDSKRFEKFVDMMYHYRIHGKWMYIKGEPRYINGWAWEYYNFWTTESGGLPDFRWEGIEFFTFFDHCWRDPDCYGMLDIKGRRMGDTDKSVYLMWAIAARYRNAWSGHQNIIEKDAYENYMRVLAGHQGMPSWFKPIMKGGSAPQTAMIFDYPEEYISAKKLKEEKKKKDRGEEIITAPTFRALKSKIDYKTSKLGQYDGKRLSFYYMDEPGKILEFVPNDQWKVIKPALALYNGVKIIGFAMFTTTVEDFASGKTLKNMKKMWDESDPSDRNENNRTITGLYRIFRDATLTATPDEWGFPKTDEAVKFIQNEIAAMEAKSDFDGLAKFKRKHPLTIADVFTPPHDECTLFPVLLDKRMEQIEKNIDPVTGKNIDYNGNLVAPKGIRGNLVWKNGIKGSTVVWQPTPNGIWVISQQPTKPNNIKTVGKRKFPGNDAEYSFGVDPVDHKIDAAIQKDNIGSDVKKHSYAAGAVFRKYNPLIDGDLLLNEEGEIMNPGLMKTDRFVLDYQHRHKNPFDFYDDMLKTAIYFGVKMHCERNKPGCINYFEQQGFGGYVLRKPKALDKNAKTKNGVPAQKGTDATSPVIQMYVDALQFHILQRIDTYDHPRILECYRQFNTENRTERDLTVSCGFALLGDIDSKKQKLEEHRTRWDKPIYAMVKRN